MQGNSGMFTDTQLQAAIGMWDRKAVYREISWEISITVTRLCIWGRLILSFRALWGQLAGKQIHRWGPGWQKVEHQPSVPLQRESQLHPGLCQQEHSPCCLLSCCQTWLSLLWSCSSPLSGIWGYLWSTVSTLSFPDWQKHWQTRL